MQEGNCKVIIMTDNKSKYKRGFIIALEIVMLVITMIVILLIYLHHSKFQVVFNPMRLDHYFKNEDIGKIIHIEGNKIAVDIPGDVITTNFNEKMKQLQLEKGYQIQDGYINTSESKAYINMTIYGINIPIAMDMILETGSRDVRMSFANITLNNKTVLSLQNGMEESLLEKLITNNDLLTVRLDDYNIPEIASIHDIILGKDKITMILTVDEGEIKDFLKNISALKSNELYGIYKRQEDAIKKKAVDIIDRGLTASEADMESVLSDILLEDEVLMKHLLIMTDVSNSDYLLENYSRYVTGFNKKDIINNKNKLILGKIDEYCAALIQQVDKLPKDKYIVNLNNPYSLERKQHITVEDMVNEYEMMIPQDVYSKMKFLYNYDNKNFMIAYKVEDNKYAIVDHDNYLFIDRDTYLGYAFDEPLENKDLLDEGVEAAIADFFGSEVFIRYMNTDGQYAYAVASDANNFQDYERFALEKRENWEIIDTNISDLYTFSMEHPGFNIRTIIDNNLNDTVYKLSKADMFAVMDQLKYRDIIPDEETVGLKYCSYDGKYISLKLTNDDEYVVSIKYSYLDKVYKKDVALKKWKDISPLILLLDKPISEDEEEIAQDSNENKE